MNMRTLKRVLSIGLRWALLWGAFWTIVFVVIRIVDPDSIDPGEGLIAFAVLGSMGLLSGVAFALLLSVGASDRTNADLSPARTAGCGVLGSAIVQLAYLDHGDLGLAANIQDALLLCAAGGVVTMVWFVMARRWPGWRPSPQSSS